MRYKLPDRVVIDTHIPTGVKIYGYTASQMHEAFAAGAASMQPKVDALQSELAALRAQPVASADKYFSYGIDSGFEFHSTLYAHPAPPSQRLKRK
jgi:hypothetical protein